MTAPSLSQPEGSGTHAPGPSTIAWMIVPVNAFVAAGAHEVWIRVHVASSKQESLEWIAEIGPTEVDAVSPWRGTVIPT